MLQTVIVYFVFLSWALSTTTTEWIYEKCYNWHTVLIWIPLFCSILLRYTWVFHTNYFLFCKKENSIIVIVSIKTKILRLENECANIILPLHFLHMSILYKMAWKQTSFYQDTPLSHKKRTPSALILISLGGFRKNKNTCPGNTLYWKWVLCSK